MEKPEVCFIRLYPDNPEDALIIAGLGTRKRKGEKSRVIKDILYSYFSSGKTGRHDYSTTALHGATIEQSSQHPSEIPVLSDDDKEILKKNLDELSDMFI
jgi:hypothetical protein